MADESALEKALRDLGDRVGLVRKAAARALGAEGDARAVPPLLAALEDGDPEVREEAARSLGKLRDKSALEPLLRLAEREEKPAVRRAADEARAAIERGPARVPRAPKKAAAAPPAPSPRDVLIHDALDGSGAHVEKTPFGYEIEVPLAARKQRVRVIFENADDEGDPLILVQSLCGPAHEKNYRWALRLNLKLFHGHIAVRRIENDDHFVFCQALLEKTTQPEELRKAVLACADKGDWVEKQITGGKDEN